MVSPASLSEVEAAIRASWSLRTCDPVDVPDWSPANRARGQCGVTALVVQDLLGGELLVADVENADGSHQGFHYWNRLPCGTELDLTRGQFARSEIVQAPRVVARPPDVRGARLERQYRRLEQSVRTRFAGAG